MFKAIYLAVFLLVCLEFTHAQIFTNNKCPDCFVTQACGNLKWT